MAMRQEGVLQQFPPFVLTPPLTSQKIVNNSFSNSGQPVGTPTLLAKDPELTNSLIWGWGGAGRKMASGQERLLLFLIMCLMLGMVAHAFSFSTLEVAQADLCEFLDSQGYTKKILPQKVN